MSLGTLLILPGLPAVRTKRGGLIITRKFVDGMRSYAERWPGRVATLLNETTQVSNNLDNIEVMPGEPLPFEIDTVKFGSTGMYRRIDQLGDVSCVLGGPHHQLHGLPRELRARGIISVLCSEYSLKTRLDVMRSETRNPIRLLRRAAWEAREEILTLWDVTAAHGVQCNGTPTFNRYRRLSASAHLYFDARTPSNGFATEKHQQLRAERLLGNAQLHIAFSGRLLKMKGAHHLVQIAQSLLRRRLRFRMTICGGGPLAKPIALSIKRAGLSSYVKLAGTLDFERELLPMMREEVDLFMAPHVQGDPSCTYLETLACGVPIVGYANEAWSGLLDRATVGWESPLGKPEKLANLIAGLDRNEIVERSAEALRFASEHSFESTFSRRVDHLVDLVREHRAFREVGYEDPGSVRGNGKELPRGETGSGSRDTVIRR